MSTIFCSLKYSTNIMFINIAVKAESEEYLNKIEKKIHVIVNEKNKSKSYPSKIPINAATPFPPLNFSQIGYK